MNGQAAEETVHDLLKAMQAGEAVIYPTETLYAVGCDGADPEACRKVIDIKARPQTKPLPLIIGGVDMLGLVTDERPAALQEMASAFWPGPLSILVKALDTLPDQVKDAEGYTSVRWSGHAFAAELSRRMRSPIVATSANLSGKPAAGLPEDIDPSLLEAVGGAYLDPPWPKGGKASTVVRVLGSSRLEVIREGAVSVKSLCDKGFSVTLAKS